MPNTTNFNWPTPADTDLVKDGAAAIRNLGNGIDTSLIDLKGGTTGQILSKASNADMDFTFVTPNVGDITEVQAGTGISVASGTGPIPVVTNSMATEITASGDIIVGTGSGTFDNLPIGTTGQILTADTTVSPYKVKWATPVSTSALTFIASATPSGAASQSFNNCFSATYQNYLMVITANSSDNDVLLQFRMRASGSDATGTDYSYQEIISRTSTTVSGFGADSQSSARIGNIDSTTGQSLHIVNIGRPFDAAYTSVRVVGTVFNDTSGVVRTSDMAAVHLLSTSYDGITLFPSGGNFTGTIRIYGYANS